MTSKIIPVAKLRVAFSCYGLSGFPFCFRSLVFTFNGFPYPPSLVAHGQLNARATSLMLPQFWDLVKTKGYIRKQLAFTIIHRVLKSSLSSHGLSIYSLHNCFWFWVPAVLTISVRFALLYSARSPLNIFISSTPLYSLLWPTLHHRAVSSPTLGNCRVGTLWDTLNRATELLVLW